MSNRIQAKIIAKQKFAFVDFDVWGLGLELTDDGSARVNTIWREYAARLRSAGIRLAKQRVTHGKSSGRFHVLKEYAVEIQSELEDVLNDPDCIQRAPGLDFASR